MGEFLFSYIPSFIWALVVFSIFVGVVFKFGVKQVMVAVAARDEQIANQLNHAEETQEQASQLQSRLDAEMAGAEAKINELMADARADGEKLRQKLVDEGQAEIEAMRQKALREIAAAKTQALVDVQTQVGDLALLVAGKVLDSELDGGRNAELIQSTLNEYQAGASA